MQEFSEKNTVDPYSVLSGSSKIAIWVCSEGHEWEASFYKRHIGIGNCPACNNKPLAGSNTLVDMFVEIAKQWSPNNDTTPDKVRADSTVKRHWICNNCHNEFTARPIDMISGNKECPYCNNRYACEGLNDLLTVDPLLAAEYSSSNKLPANQVKRTSVSYALWICPSCGGEYSAQIRKREVNDNSCPYCNNKKIMAGNNSFADQRPDILRFWDETNNYALLDPYHASINDPTPVWWYCENDAEHKYMMPISDRLMFDFRGIDPCPTCKGRRKKKTHFVIQQTKKELY